MTPLIRITAWATLYLTGCALIGTIIGTIIRIVT